MKPSAVLKQVYGPSRDVVTRDVHGEFLLIPVTAGVGGEENTIFSLNETGRAIWARLDGKKSVGQIAKELKADFEGPSSEIKSDVVGLTQELRRRKMIVEVC